MPLWKIYHPPSVFTDAAEKEAIAKAITSIYTAVPLPAFYANVLFIPIEPTSFYIGGVARPSPHKAENEPGPNSSVPFIQISVKHVARKMQDTSAHSRMLAKVNQVLKPYIADKGYDWEINIEEHSRDLWMTQGLVPPTFGTEAEKEWVKQNKAIPYNTETGGIDPKI